MHYTVLRRADAQSETGRLAQAESALLLAALKPSDTGVRISIRNGEATVTPGPFPDPADMIAGFAIVEAPSKEGALEWLRGWPESGHSVEFEIRECGWPCGRMQVVSADNSELEGKRFVILLRSSPALEAEAHMAQHVRHTLDAHNVVEVRKGVLLAADGLRGSARGVRVSVAQGVFSVIDGPFSEIRKLIAGFWLIRVPALEDAIVWATHYPYPVGPDVEVEIRELFDASDSIERFIPDLQSEEQRIRAGQLDAGRRAHFTA